MSSPGRYDRLYKDNPNPEGCDDCGLDRHEHVPRWTPTARWHTYIRPSTALIAQRRRKRERDRERQVLDQVLGRETKEVHHAG